MVHPSRNSGGHRSWVNVAWFGLRLPLGSQRREPGALRGGSRRSWRLPWRVLHQSSVALTERDNWAGPFGGAAEPKGRLACQEDHARFQGAHEVPQGPLREAEFLEVSPGVGGLAPGGVCVGDRL